MFNKIGSTEINLDIAIFFSPPIPNLDTLLQNRQLLFVCHGLLPFQ